MDMIGKEADNMMLLEPLRQACYTVKYHKIRARIADLYGVLMLEQNPNESKHQNVPCLIIAA
jgi:hypothetical protein